MNSVALDPGFAARLDGDMRLVLQTLTSLGGAPIQTLSPTDARRQPSLSDAAQAILRERGRDAVVAPAGVTTRDFVIPGLAGDLPARLYSPETAKTQTDKPSPVVVFYHGGGWVVGGLDAADATPRALAKSANCIVISCSYRLAPEHPFPAQQDDAFAAYRWVRENAETLGGDPLKIAVMGESAGGNLALNVAVQARDSQAKTQGLGEHGLVRRDPVPPPCYMVLVYPVAGTDLETESYKEIAQAPALDRAKMAWFLEQAIETDGDRSDPRLDLASAELAGLPDATLILAEVDPLRSEGEALARKLQDAGSEVRSHVFKGVTHGFFGLAPVVGKARLAQEMVIHNLKRAFGTAVLPI